MELIVEVPRLFNQFLSPVMLLPSALCSLVRAIETTWTFRIIFDRVGTWILVVLEFSG